MKTYLFIIFLYFNGFFLNAQNPTNNQGYITTKDRRLHTNSSAKLIINPDSIYIFNSKKHHILDSLRNNKNDLPYDDYVLKSELEKCVHLKEVYLHADKNISFDFKPFKELEIVHLDFEYSDQQIEDLVNNAKNLKILYLSSYRSVPDRFYDLKSLEYLNFKCYKKNIDERISNLTNLKRLYLSRYDDNLNKSIWTIPNLEILELPDSKLIIIPENCSSKIKYLKITKADSIIFPEKTKGFDSLKLIYLEDIKNQINGQNAINNFKNLRGFYCKKTVFDCFPRTKNLSLFEELVLSDCFFNDYNPDFASNKKLERIDLYDNTSKYKIDKLPKNMKSLKNLVSFSYAMYNVKIPRYFKKFKKLKKLLIKSRENNFELEYKYVKRIKKFNLPNLQIFYFQLGKDWTEKQRDELEIYRANMKEKTDIVNFFNLEIEPD